MPEPGHFKNGGSDSGIPRRLEGKNAGETNDSGSQRMHNEHFFILSPFKRAL
jgi:hypothetical protein